MRWSWPEPPHARALALRRSIFFEPIRSTHYNPNRNVASGMGARPLAAGFMHNTASSPGAARAQNVSRLLERQAGGERRWGAHTPNRAGGRARENK